MVPVEDGMLGVEDNKAAQDALACCECREHPIIENMQGVECKALLDAWGMTTNGAVIVDLKTCLDSSPREFARDVINRDYDLQLAWYSTLLGIRLSAGYPPAFYWLAVEKAAPFTSVLYDGSEFYASGMAKLDLVLTRFKECAESGEWPQPNPGINTLRCPDWVLRSVENAKADPST